MWGLARSTARAYRKSVEAKGATRLDTLEPMPTDEHEVEDGPDPLRQERRGTRRREDADASDFIRDMYRWFRRSPRILAAAGGIIVGAAAVASWLGAQSSSPGQRITDLEAVVKTTSAAAKERVDTLASVVDSLRGEVAEGRAEATVLRADMQLLLKLGCRPITDEDLRRDCIDRGARRPNRIP